MGNFRFVEPCEEYKSQILDFKHEVEAIHETEKYSSFSGTSGLDEFNDLESYFIHIQVIKDKEMLPQGYVPSTTLMYVKNISHKIVGFVDIRHSIDTPILSSIGGHIGYTIAPSERGHGHSISMLKGALIKCKKLNLDRVLITCEDGNIKSEKTILACGGVFESNIEADGKIFKRFWIKIK